MPSGIRTPASSSMVGAKSTFKAILSLTEPRWISGDNGPSAEHGCWLMHETFVVEMPFAEEKAVVGTEQDDGVVHLPECSSAFRTLPTWSSLLTTPA